MRSGRRNCIPQPTWTSPNVLDKAIISESPTIQSNGSESRTPHGHRERRVAKEDVVSDVIATHAYHLVNQESGDSAPLPLTTMTRRSDRSNTKYSTPSPFFDPNQFSVHPSGQFPFGEGLRNDCCLSRSLCGRDSLCVRVQCHASGRVAKQLLPHFDVCAVAS